MYGAVKDIRLIRDKFTGMSRGFCFVEYFAVESAIAAYEAVTKRPTRIDGRVIKVSYTSARGQVMIVFDDILDDDMNVAV